jgi:hypothetical protein
MVQLPLGQTKYCLLERCDMSRISIEVSPEQHQRLKAFAALRGETIKDYILGCALPPSASAEVLTEEQALQELEQLLLPRVEAIKRGEISAKSFEEIIAEARNEAAVL